MIIFDSPTAYALATQAATLLGVTDTEEAGQLAVLAYDEVDMEAPDALEQLLALWHITQGNIAAGELAVDWYL